MSGPVFYMKSSDLVNLRKFYKRAPYEFNRVMLNMMNSFAFGTRAVSLSIIRKYMVVRATKWVEGRVRVQKAYGSRPEAEMGSIVSPRFTGWVEQELGTGVKRTRVAGIMSRKGDVKNKMIGAARLRPNASHITPEQYQGKRDSARTAAMIGDIRRRGLKTPFIVKNHRKIKTGLYRMRNGRIELLQLFKTKKQPRRVKWMSGALKLYMTHNRVRNEWAKSIRHVLRLRR